MLRSSIRWRVKSYATSVPTGSLKPQKGQLKPQKGQRITKQERRVMVESVVNKYRSSNGGKFPNVSNVLKETGGSYYVVRQMVQELEYLDKHSPSSKTVEAQKDIFPSSGLKEKSSAFEVEEVSSSNLAEMAQTSLKLDETIKVDDQLIKDGAIVHSVIKERPSSSDVVEKFSVAEPRGCVTTVAKYSNEHILNGYDARVLEKDVPSGIVEESLRDITRLTSQSEESKVDLSISLKSETTVNALNSPTRVSEDKKDTNAIKHDPQVGRVELIKDHEAPKHVELSGDHPRRLDHGETEPKTRTVWENLKSLAGGIIKIWKRM